MIFILNSSSSTFLLLLDEEIYETSYPGLKFYIESNFEGQIEYKTVRYTLTGDQIMVQLSLLRRAKAYVSVKKHV